jgi:hypothetical protein
MKPIQIIAQDLFDKVRSRFSNLEMGNEAGAVTIDPAEARFFDFDFVNEGHNLGRVSISLNNLGSLKIYYSQGITENQDDPAKRIWYKFLKEMRMFAMRRLLRFDTRDIAKTNLDKNDFQHLAATQGPKEEPEMTTTMNESRWNQKSTKKTSRAVKGKTEVIVRHAHPVDETFAGSRSQRKNIKAIFIQNEDGERFKYPFIHPAGAFAMAQHVDHGGIPHDPAGKAIINMSEQIAQLQEFQRKIQRTSLHDDATGITERAVGRLQELKARIEGLSKRHHYESWMAEFNEQEHMDDDIMELDAVTMEQYKQTFTQSTFQEELAGYFPLLHRIMSEANKVDLEEYVEEAAAPWETDDEAEAREKDGKKQPSAFKKPNNPNRTGNDTAKALAQKGIPKKEGFEQFEEWAEATEQGKLTDDQITALKQALTDLPEGQLDLDTAYNFFSEFGIDDSDLEDKLRQASELDSTTDPIQVFQLWANENYPELLVALGMSNTEAPAEEPAPEVGAEPNPMPAPEQPVAEGSGRMINGKEIDMRSLEIDGVDPRDYPDFSDAYISHASFTDGTDLSDEEMDQLNDQHGDLVHELAYDSLHENTDMVPPPGAMEEGEKEGKGSMVQEVAKIVKSFYNRDNPEVGPFRGEEGIVIDVEKQISEKFGEAAGQQAGKMAEAFMQKLTQEWQQKHGDVANGHGDDGLARLKELLGNVKSKVEGIGDQGQGGRDFNKNIMPAEENTDVDADLVSGKFYVMSSPSGQEGESPDNPPGGFNSAEEAEQAKYEIFQGSPDEMISRIPVMQWNGKQFVPTLDEEEASHQTKTTMKHADNPTYQQRAASHAIKPGIPGYQDRIDMLKDLERTGKLKKEDLTAFEDIMRLAGLAK